MTETDGTERIDMTTTVDEEAAKTHVGRWRVSTSAVRAYSMVIALVLIWLYFEWRTGGVFLRPVNLANLLKQMSVTGVLAVGMLFVIVARQIDLSVGSLVGLAGGIAAMTQGWGLLPSFASAIVVGVAACPCPARRRRRRASSFRRCSSRCSST